MGYFQSGINSAKSTVFDISWYYFSAIKMNGPEPKG